MNYFIEFFNETVEADIMAWPAGIRASFTRITERITEYGPNLGLPYTRAMGGDLFENGADSCENF